MNKSKKTILIWVLIGSVIVGISLVILFSFSTSPSSQENKPGNQPPPSVSEIEEKYNNDQQKNEIANATDLSESEKKQAQEKLKKLIEAEISLKRKKFNSQLLNELRELKVKNTKIYQKLNKDGRVDKVIEEWEKKEPDEPSENPQNPPAPEEENNCPYLKEHDFPVPREKTKEEYLAELKKIPSNFVVQGWKKGYHWQDILQLWEWKIPASDIPDLKVEKRVGVIRELAVTNDFDKLNRGEIDPNNPGGMPLKGESRNLVVICRQISTGGLKINIDKNIQEHEMTKYSDDYDENATRNYTRELINLALSQEKDINLQQYEVSLLWSLGTENFRKEKEIGWGDKTSGTSAGSAIYLALLSSLHKLTIGNKVCATGTIKMKEEKVKNLSGQEVILKRGDNTPIGSLKEKTIGAVEKGLTQLVLSKYHSAPNILTKPSKKNPGKNLVSDNYEEVVPAEIKAKMKVYWTENTKELWELIFQAKLS